MNSNLSRLRAPNPLPRAVIPGLPTGKITLSCGSKSWGRKDDVVSNTMRWKYLTAANERLYYYWVRTIARTNRPGRHIFVNATGHPHPGIERGAAMRGPVPFRENPRGGLRPFSLHRSTSAAGGS